MIAAAAVLCAIAVDLVVLRTRLLARRAFWVSYAIVLAFQLLMNGVLAGLPVVSYDPRAILGPRIARAPIEDIGFGFAMIALTLSVWVWLGRTDRRRRTAGAADRDRRDRRDQRRRARPEASSRPTATARRPSPTHTRRSRIW